MDGHILSIGHLISFKQQLRSEEREQSTIEKYMRELKLLGAWLVERPVTAEIVSGWKNYLRTAG